jgi:hypothetical protein
MAQFGASPTDDASSIIQATDQAANSASHSPKENYPKMTFDRTALMEPDSFYTDNKHCYTVKATATVKIGFFFFFSANSKKFA